MQSEIEIASSDEAALNSKISYFSQRLPVLSTGSRAELRRGPLKDGEAGAPAFWKLLLDAGFDLDRMEVEQLLKWAAILQAMACLTPRPAVGDDNPKGPHDPSNRFGTALCDGGGGDGWLEGQKEATRAGGTPRPVLSEPRLAKMLAAKGKLRRELVVRAAKTIAGSKSKKPVNCADFARFLLYEDDDKPIRQIATDYYKLFARAEKASKADKTN